MAKNQKVESWECLERSGHSLFSSYRNSSAERIADLLVSQVPERSYGYYLKAELYRRRRSWALAIQWFEQALDQGDTSGWSEYRIAECLYRFGQLRAAENWAHRCLRDYKNTPSIIVAAKALLDTLASSPSTS